MQVKGQGEYKISRGRRTLIHPFIPLSPTWLRLVVSWISKFSLVKQHLCLSGHKLAMQQLDLAFQINPPLVEPQSKSKLLMSKWRMKRHLRGQCWKMLTSASVPCKSLWLLSKLRQRNLGPLCNQSPPWLGKRNLLSWGYILLVWMHLSSESSPWLICDSTDTEKAGKPGLWALIACYNFFPLSRLFPRLHSMTPLLLLCSLLPRDQSIPTCLPILFLSSCTSSLVLPCSTGLSYSLVTSLMVTTFPLPSIEFYNLPR